MVCLPELQLQDAAGRSRWLDFTGQSVTEERAAQNGSGGGREGEGLKEREHEQAQEPCRTPSSERCEHVSVSPDSPGKQSQGEKRLL